MSNGDEDPGKWLFAKHRDRPARADELQEIIETKRFWKRVVKVAGFVFLFIAGAIAFVDQVFDAWSWFK